MTNKYRYAHKSFLWHLANPYWIFFLPVEYEDAEENKETQGVEEGKEKHSLIASEEEIECIKTFCKALATFYLSFGSAFLNIYGREPIGTIWTTYIVIGAGRSVVRWVGAEYVKAYGFMTFSFFLYATADMNEYALWGTAWGMVKGISGIWFWISSVVTFAYGLRALMDLWSRCFPDGLLGEYDAWKIWRREKGARASHPDEVVPLLCEESASLRLQQGGS